MIAIEPILRQRGIVVIAPAAGETAFAPECRHVAAEVASGGGRIVVWITDPDGRRVQRSTEDPAAAATVIESWARRDLVDPLFAARASLRVGPFAPPTPKPVATATTRSRYLIVAGGDAGVSGDGAVWSGFHAHGCAALGRVCLGGALRWGIDLEQTGDTAELDTARTAFDVTLTAELPLRARGRSASISRSTSRRSPASGSVSPTASIASSPRLRCSTAGSASASRTESCTRSMAW